MIFAIILSLLLSVILVKAGIGIGIIIGIFVILAAGLAGIAYLMKGGEEIGSETEEEKFRYEDRKEARTTALGCYGPEAEEEKFGHYEEPPPQKSHQRERSEQTQQDNPGCE